VSLGRKRKGRKRMKRRKKGEPVPTFREREKKKKISFQAGFEEREAGLVLSQRKELGFAIGGKKGKREGGSISRFIKRGKKRWVSMSKGKKN